MTFNLQQHSPSIYKQPGGPRHLAFEPKWRRSTTIGTARRFQDVKARSLFSLPPLPARRRRSPQLLNLLASRTARHAAARISQQGHSTMTVQTGVVKWFNESKGYGFITPDDGGKDLFAHFREIQGGGFKSLTENQRVQFAVTQGPKGPQASNISSVG